MDFNKFAEYIKKELEKIYGKYTVRIVNVTKNNNLRLTGISVQEDDTNIAPTIYLNEYYDYYKKNGGFDHIIGEIKKIYENNRMKNHFDTSVFLDFERAKPRIICKLINYEKNWDLLKEVPYIQFLDLAIVFQYLFQDVADGTATILIRNEHLPYWKTSKGELYQIALKNTPQLLKSCIESMYDIINKIMGISTDYEEESIIPMYVLSNKERINGAVCILYKDALKKFADSINSDIYILPSSIHEVIIVPATGEWSGEEFSEMVRTVNETEVTEDEILSDNVYYFSRNTNQLTIC